MKLVLQVLEKLQTGFNCYQKRACSSGGETVGMRLSGTGRTLGGGVIFPPPALWPFSNTPYRQSLEASLSAEKKCEGQRHRSGATKVMEKVVWAESAGTSAKRWTKSLVYYPM